MAYVAMVTASRLCACFIAVVFMRSYGGRLIVAPAQSHRTVNCLQKTDLLANFGFALCISYGRSGQGPSV